MMVILIVKINVMEEVWVEMNKANQERRDQ